jgi:subtilisin family serine protease
MKLSCDTVGTSPPGSTPDTRLARSPMGSVVARPATAHRALRSLSTLLALVTAGMVMLPAAAAARGSESLAGGTTPPIQAIVRGLPGAGTAPERAVVALGGTVIRRLGIIDGFVASVPPAAVPRLAASAGVRSVTPDGQVRLHGSGWDDKADGDEKDSTKFHADLDLGSLYNTTKLIGAQSLWARGVTGRGVDVAVLDTGTVPVDGLRTPDKVVQGADLSFESQAPSLRYLDTNGHGTHMAGIIAGREDAVKDTSKADPKLFAGVAPDARIVNVKVGVASGAVDVSQVIAAIDWVVAHRTDSGMNIRVLNLSFGTDGVQSYLLDPLTYAAEVAWRKGIVVVVAAGNRGPGDTMMTNPAYDPYLLAVGASDHQDTLGAGDDVAADFSSRGNSTRGPDLVAPGRSIISLRNPGSNVDLEHPLSMVATRFTRGSGSSQATAVVSGAAALLLQQRPWLTPDQVKALLRTTATRLPQADAVAQGQGLVNVDRASQATPTTVPQTFPTATGTGSLELARGSAHVVDNGIELAGEQDIFGTAWDGATWAQTSWNGTSWVGGSWNGVDWTDGAWVSDGLLGRMWSGRMWSGRMWSGEDWGTDGAATNTWSGVAWSGRMWSGETWSGRMWSGRMWSGDNWN